MNKYQYINGNINGYNQWKYQWIYQWKKNTSHKMRRIYIYICIYNAHKYIISLFYKNTSILDEVSSSSLDSNTYKNTSIPRPHLCTELST